MNKEVALYLPKHINWRRLFSRSIPLASNLALISAGTILWVIGMNSILVPNKFLSGGIAGIAILLHYLFPSLSIAWSFLALNIPLMILGWRNISRKFMMYSVYGMCFFTLVADLIKLPALNVDDPILAALSAGVICGVGGGLVLRSQGSGGGLDVLAVYLKKKFGFQIGFTIFLFNALILSSGIFFYSVQMALYTCIFLFTTGKIVDAVLSGFNRRKSLMIISEKSEAIAEALLCDKNRGITFLRGEGGFTHQEKKVIYTITNFLELPKIKAAVLNLDPDAFMVVHDTSEVFGKRYKMGGYLIPIKPWRKQI